MGNRTLKQNAGVGRRGLFVLLLILLLSLAMTAFADDDLTSDDMSGATPITSMGELTVNISSGGVRSLFYNSGFDKTIHI